MSIAYRNRKQEADMPTGTLTSQAVGERILDLVPIAANAISTPVQALGHTWQADEGSQALLTKAITMALAGLPLPAVWRSRDNYDMAVDTIGDLLAIAGAMAAQTQTAYATSWARKAMLAAAETIEEIDAV